MILKVYHFTELPTEAQALICKCADNVFGPYPKLDWKIKWMATCTECKKQRIDQLHECMRCEQYFIKDFRHPGFCWRTPECWDCLEPDAYCRHCEQYCPPLFSTAIVPPRKVKYILPDNFDPTKPFEI